MSLTHRQTLQRPSLGPQAHDCAPWKCMGGWNVFLCACNMQHKQLGLRTSYAYFLMITVIADDALLLE